MDVLGSILNSMEKPPSKSQSTGEKQKSAYLKKLAANEKRNLEVFRNKVVQKVESFMCNETVRKLQFEPMSKVKRSVIHDVAEVAGVIAYSFGDEEIDRHVILFKRDFLPSEDELAALRKGQEWTPQIQVVIRSTP